MNNSISKFLVIALLLLNVNQIVKAKVVDAVSGATPVKLKIEANADKQLVLDVSYEENSVIREAPLGLNVDHRQLGKDVQLLNKEKKENNTLVYQLQQADGSLFYLDARIFQNLFLFFGICPHNCRVVRYKFCHFVNDIIAKIIVFGKHGPGKGKN